MSKQKKRVSKILIAFGTRPEAIKLAPVISELQESFSIKVCVSMQHREMLTQVLEIFNIKPDYNLNIMKKNQDLFDIHTKVLSGMKKIIQKYSPDLLLVHGDTTTSMASAVAAYYLKVPIGHIEAGLRTYNIFSPFPEEFNRQIIGKLSNFNFAPTENSKKNLVSEGVNEKSIFVTGNTVIDTLFMVLEQARSHNFSNKIIIELPFLSSDNQHALPKIILITGHRRENFGHKIRQICLAIKDLSTLYPNIKFIYPVHPNPNILDSVKAILSGIDNIYLIKPLDYLSFVKLLDLSYIVLTDSGGIQEEAPSLGKPVLVLRDETERPEAIEAGTVILVGSSKENIINKTKKLLDNPNEYKSMAKAVNPYGDGNASRRINNIIKKIKV